MVLAVHASDTGLITISIPSSRPRVWALPWRSTFCGHTKESPPGPFEVRAGLSSRPKSARRGFECNDGVEAGHRQHVAHHGGGAANVDEVVEASCVDGAGEDAEP